jgi:hypothetical protein
MHVALCKSFAFAQAIVDTNSLMHLLTYLLLCSSLLYSLYFQSQQGVCHTTGLPFALKSGGNRCIRIQFFKYLKAKEELWKLKYFTMQKYINLQKIL